MNSQATIAKNPNVTESKYNFFTVWQSENPSICPIGMTGTLPMLKKMYPNVKFFRRTRVGQMSFDAHMPYSLITRDMLK